ncbi:hypothetical protein SAMN05216532_1767 [Streptomyces sp. 2231.1]|nr:hypothetical protein SAMN05216532_1767 [Streptomyces sp. 2231.1]
MSGLRVGRLAERRAARGRAVRRGLRAAVAAAVTGIGTVTGALSALGDGHGSDRARPAASHRAIPAPPPAVP